MNQAERERLEGDLALTDGDASAVLVLEKFDASTDADLRHAIEADAEDGVLATDLSEILSSESVVQLHLKYALTCLQQDVPTALWTGLRSQAIAHIRQALLSLEKERNGH